MFVNEDIVAHHIRPLPHDMANDPPPIFRRRPQPSTSGESTYSSTARDDTDTVIVQPQLSELEADISRDVEEQRVRAGEPSYGRPFLDRFSLLPSSIIYPYLELPLSPSLTECSEKVPDDLSATTRAGTRLDLYMGLSVLV